MRYLQTVLISVFIGMVLNQTKAQNLYIQLNDGSITTNELVNIQKLSFSGADLVVHFGTGTTDVYELSSIRKLYFQENVAVAETLPTTSTLRVFPNPAHSSIIIQGLPIEPSLLHVFKSDGQLVYSSSHSSNDASINITSFAPGLYLLKANNQTLKFIKQ